MAKSNKVYYSINGDTTCKTIVSPSQVVSHIIHRVNLPTKVLSEESFGVNFIAHSTKSYSAAAPKQILPANTIKSIEALYSLYSLVIKLHLNCVQKEGVSISDKTNKLSLFNKSFAIVTSDVNTSNSFKIVVLSDKEPQYNSKVVLVKIRVLKGIHDEITGFSISSYTTSLNKAIEPNTVAIPFKQSVILKLLSKLKNCDTLNSNEQFGDTFNAG